MLFLNINKIQNYLSLAVLFLSVITLIICFYFPVYTDEILWKALQGRYWDDGKKMLNCFLMPSCKQYSLEVPALLLPFRLLNSLLFGQLTNPLAIRLFGISMGLLWLGVTGFLLSNLMSTHIKNKTLVLCLISFSTLGVMPFMLVLSRPEQFLLLGITIFFIPLLKNSLIHTQKTYFKSCINALGILLLALFLFTVHLKAMFALPIILLSIYQFVRIRWLTYICIFIACTLALVTYHYWMNAFSCPGDPLVVTQQYRNLNIGFSLHSFNAFKQYISVLMNVLNSPASWFLPFIVQKNNYVSNMIPPFRGALSLNFGIILWAFLHCIVSLGFMLFLYDLLRKWHVKSTRISYIAIGTIWLFYFSCVFARIDKNDYEAALLVPLLALALTGTVFISWATLEELLEKHLLNRVFQIFFLVLLTFSVFSQIFLISNFIPYVMTSWGHPGYLKDQDFSISNFHYNMQRTKIIETAEKCGIYKKNQLQHLVVDELTYFSFQNSYQPFFMTALDEHHWGKNHPDPSKLLKEYKSAGMIVACPRVPAALKEKVIKNGEFCCMPMFNAL